MFCVMLVIFPTAQPRQPWALLGILRVKHDVDIEKKCQFSVYGNQNLLNILVQVAQCLYLKKAPTWIIMQKYYICDFKYTQPIFQ